MKTRTKKALGALAVLLIAGGALLGWPALEQTLSVGTGYAAKRLCSEVHLAGRDKQEVWDEDLALLPKYLLSWSIDEEAKTATVSGLGLVTQVAVWRAGLGCALTNGTTVEDVRAMAISHAPVRPLVSEQLWPKGTGKPEVLPEGVDREKLDEALDFAFAEPDPEHPRLTRAVVVIYDGQLVAERYAPGFTRDTPLLSWSMAKSVTNAMIGVLVQKQMLDIHQPAPVPEWSEPADPRNAITTDALLRMSSGLDFDETYGAFGDVTDMLFVSHSTAERAARVKRADISGKKWSYSSGDTNILSRIVLHTLKGRERYHRFPTEELFHKIDIHSATFETDPAGVFVGSSFVYMTARDWARFGLLYLQDGVWEGARILPAGWVEYSCALTPGTPRGEYGAQFWLNRGVPEGSKNRPYPSAPIDLCTASGFETQRVAFIPSRKAVIVRLGLTRKRGDFPTDAFFGKVLAALPEPAPE